MDSGAGGRRTGAGQVTETTTITDRALDAWLAEHLFGWEVVGNRRGNWSLKEPGGQWQGGSFMKERGRPWASTTHCISWATTGDGMLAVLEAMRKREWRALMGTWSTGPGYRCQFYTITNEERVSALAGSLPRAVALAAKAALEASA